MSLVYLDKMSFEMVVIKLAMYHLDITLDASGFRDTIETRFGAIQLNLLQARCSIY